VLGVTKQKVWMKTIRSGAVVILLTVLICFVDQAQFVWSFTAQTTIRADGLRRLESREYRSIYSLWIEGDAHAINKITSRKLSLCHSQLIANEIVEPSIVNKTDAEQIVINAIKPQMSQHSSTDHEEKKIEGIRRTKTSSILSNILTKENEKPKFGRKYAERTIAGLILAIAEEASGLEVSVEARENTPFSRKHVDNISIDFDRLGFRPLRIRGVGDALAKSPEIRSPKEKEAFRKNLLRRRNPTADEAFQIIDVDKSGALDAQELTKALDMAISSTHGDESYNNPYTLSPRGYSYYTKSNILKKKVALKTLATKLVSLYDTNGDKVLDREEYQRMVKDMAVLRINQGLKRSKKNIRKKGIQTKNFIQQILSMRRPTSRKEKTTHIITDMSSMNDTKSSDLNLPANNSSSSTALIIANDAGSNINRVDVMSTSGDELQPKSERRLTSSSSVENNEVIETFRGEGSIILSDLKLDMRRLFFGALPIVKKLIPGGPLVLEPFSMVIQGSVTADDVMESNLLEAGLCRLVERVLRKRVRSVRDLVDGAFFFGRTWKMSSETAPKVEAPKLKSVEFDTQNRLIISGKALVQSSPSAPEIEQAFKLRARIGTSDNGHCIKLVDTELALVVGCPKSLEEATVSICKKFNWPIPTRPEPIYSYIPLLSKKPSTTGRDGFYVGEDNCIKSIHIRNGKLLFELSAILKPGRFLGEHYIAFAIPNRTFIITMDRIKDGIRTARRNKKEADAAAQKKKDAEVFENAMTTNINDLKFSTESSSHDQNRICEDENNLSESSKEKKTFFSKFMKGYISASKADAEEESDEMISSALSEWFGRQEVDVAG